MTESFLQLIIIPVLKDNYCYMIAWDSSAIVIDPGEAGPVIDRLVELQLELVAVLCTHHHADHVGGNKALKKYSDCRIIGPEDPRVPGLDTAVGQGNLTVGAVQLKVLEVPGHTHYHLAYHLPQNQMVFTGDSLFCGGSGRLFEGTPEQMIDSLAVLTRLPGATQVYCGHEYTLKNLEFAHSIEPNYFPVEQRLEEVRNLREQGRPSVPSTIGLEKQTNPFLRVGESSLRTALGMEDASDAEVFAEIRERRNAI